MDGHNMWIKKKRVLKLRCPGCGRKFAASDERRMSVHEVLDEHISHCPDALRLWPYAAYNRDEDPERG